MKGFFGDRYEKFSDQVSIWWQISPYECLVWKGDIFIFRSRWWQVWINFIWWPDQVVTNLIWNEKSNSFQMVTWSNGDMLCSIRINRFISNGDTIKWWHIWFEMENDNRFFIPLLVWLPWATIGVCVGLWVGVVDIQYTCKNVV